MLVPIGGSPQQLEPPSHNLNSVSGNDDNPFSDHGLSFVALAHNLTPPEQAKNFTHVRAASLSESYGCVSRCLAAITNSC